MSVIAPARVVTRADLKPAATLAASRVGRKKFTLRTATAGDADAIYALITSHLAEGHLLPRRREEIVARAHRFVVAVHASRIVACAELAPLSRAVAEIRSLVVSGDARSGGLGRRLIEELLRRAAIAGFEKLCAFTHSPAYFVHRGFSIVPHAWLPEKMVTDCASCTQFPTCGQYAVVQNLVKARHSCVPLTALHG